MRVEILNQRCPGCGHETLVVVDGHLDCGFATCPDPDAAARALGQACTIVPIYRQKSTPIHIVDGDTFDLRVDTGFSIETTQRIRLKGIDTPEIKGATKIRGLAARDFSERAIAQAKALVTQTHKLPDGQRDDKTLGRYVADVWVDGVSLARLLREAGHVADVERLG